MWQVEHPVTEWISGVNIPSCQLMIGMGVGLHRMADIRRLFGKDADGTDPIGLFMISTLLKWQLVSQLNSKCRLQMANIRTVAEFCPPGCTTNSVTAEAAMALLC